MPEQKPISLTLIFLKFALALSLASCGDNDAKRYAEPYEFLRIEAFGINGESFEHNDHSANFINLDGRYFPIGQGKCIAHLASIDQRTAEFEMRAFNSFLDEEKDWNDVRAARLVAQCVAVQRVDRNCVAIATKKYVQHLKEQKREEAEELYEEVMGLGECRKPSPIGPPRTFSLQD